MRPLAILRPQPGNAATCARIVERGGRALAIPLFAVRPLAWTPPDPSSFDALLLTSANAVRHAGDALASYRDLPVFAVGATTAAIARAAGLTVATIGPGTASELAALAASHGVGRALHLTGRDRAGSSLPGVAATIAVYASDECAVSTADLARLSGSVTLIHSPRAGARLAALVRDRADVRIAAISPAALAAAGPGWDRGEVADRPDDESLIAAALSLAD